MPNVRIVTDTVAQLPPEVAKKFSVEVVPAAMVLSKRKWYVDGVDLTPAFAETLLEESPNRFSTTAIPPSYFAKTFEKLSASTREILCITLSSKLSAVYNSATLACQHIALERPDVKIRVFDSLNASGGEGLIAVAAAKAAAKGMSLEETAAVAKRASDMVLCMFVFDTVRYVYRTGRVPKAVGEAADRLGVRPICKIGRDGKIHFAMLARSRKNGVQQILEAGRRCVGELTIDAAIIHTAAEDDAQELRSRVEAEFKCQTVFVSEFSPLMAYATGPGVLGLAVCPVE